MSVGVKRTRESEQERYGRGRSEGVNRQSDVALVNVNVRLDTPLQQLMLRSQGPKLYGDLPAGVAAGGGGIDYTLPQVRDLQKNNKLDQARDGEIAFSYMDMPNKGYTETRRTEGTSVPVLTTLNGAPRLGGAGSTDAQSVALLQKKIRFEGIIASPGTIDERAIEGTLGGLRDVVNLDQHPIIAKKKVYAIASTLDELRHGRGEKEAKSGQRVTLSYRTIDTKGLQLMSQRAVQPILGGLMTTLGPLPAQPRVYADYKTHADRVKAALERAPDRFAKAVYTLALAFARTGVLLMDDGELAATIGVGNIPAGQEIAYAELVALYNFWRNLPHFIGATAERFALQWSALVSATDAMRSWEEKDCIGVALTGADPGDKFRLQIGKPGYNFS